MNFSLIFLVKMKNSTIFHDFFLVKTNFSIFHDFSFSGDLKQDDEIAEWIDAQSQSSKTKK